MIVVPREICRDLSQALAREWLVTNGLGGYASSSITGANTRRYHGLLVAALKPPSARIVMLAKIDEEVEVGDAVYRLGTNEYESGTIHPEGYLYLERVELDAMIPTFVYRAPDFTLTKSVWMEHGHNTTYVRYALSGDSRPIQLTLLPFCTYADFHTEARGSLDWHMGIRAQAGEIEVTAFSGAVAYRLIPLPSAAYVPLDLWYWRFRHRVEQERGLDSVQDLYLPGLLRAQLAPGGSIALAATTEETNAVDRDAEAALARERARQQALATPEPNGRASLDDFEGQLRVAADQFVVERSGAQLRASSAEAPARTVIAGYHWFGDWGRDTMISLEGLTLVTGRLAEARDILLTFGRYCDQGMIPNRFPDIQATASATPVEYNTVDATLWYLHALSRYLEASGDEGLLRELFSTLASIVDWHVKGTRYNIRVDAADGLLSAGAPGVQLTWMDAKVGEWVVTPRMGKPVEVNALWYHALRLMEKWASRLGEPAGAYASMAKKARASFDKYWYAEGGYLYDVVDGPDGNDCRLRPNQLFALSLADDLVSTERARSILNVVQRHLLTPFGLRTLSPQDPSFHAYYRGDQRERDAAYHQGIVWPWLIGAYVDAYVRVYADRSSARALLEGLRGQLTQGGLGTFGEIYEAQPPFRPVGCIAQAWSVAEVLRALAKTLA